MSILVQPVAIRCVIFVRSSDESPNSSLAVEDDHDEYRRSGRMTLVKPERKSDERVEGIMN